MQWYYVLVFNGEYDQDEQGFAESMSASYEVAKEMATPVFVDVESDEAYEYVVIHDGSMSEDTDWLQLIREDREDVHMI